MKMMVRMKMSEEIKEKPKLDLKELRKDKEFMKTLYDQKYVNFKWSLNRIAKHLEQITEESITGKTISNDFKGFGFELRPSRKMGRDAPIELSEKVDVSKLDQQEDLMILQKLLIFYKLQNFNSGKGFKEQVVPDVILDVAKKMVFENKTLREIFEQNKEMEKLREENNQLKQKNHELESTLTDYLNFQEKVKEKVTLLKDRKIDKLQ